MTKKSNLSENLRQLMVQASINEAVLARKSGIPQPTINRILSGNTHFPRGDTLKKLANIFVIDISTLLGNAPMLENRIPGAHNPNKGGLEILPEIPWDLVPQWEEIKHQLRKKGWKNWILTDAVVSADSFILCAEGEIMTSHFIKGTKLVIDPACTPRDRDFVIICAEGQTKATLKQLFYDGEEIYLKPLNPEFKTTTLQPEDKILGVIIQAKTDFR